MSILLRLVAQLFPEEIVFLLEAVDSLPEIVLGAGLVEGFVGHVFVVLALVRRGGLPGQHFPAPDDKVAAGLGEIVAHQ